MHRGITNREIVTNIKKNLRERKPDAVGGHTMVEMRERAREKDENGKPFFGLVTLILIPFDFMEGNEYLSLLLFLKGVGLYSGAHLLKSKLFKTNFL